jgi:GTP-binding protein HflX
VHDVLREIGADEVPELLVVNKSDVADSRDVKELLAAHAGAIAVSAATGDGTHALLDAIGARLHALIPIVELEVPYERGDVIATLHRDAEVLVEVHGDGGTRVRARLPRVDVSRFAEFVVGNGT